jgi:hypothetical protein
MYFPIALCPLPQVRSPFEEAADGTFKLNKESGQHSSTGEWAPSVASADSVVDPYIRALVRIPLEYTLQLISIDSYSYSIQALVRVNLEYKLQLISIDSYSYIIHESFLALCAMHTMRFAHYAQIKITIANRTGHNRHMRW